MGRKQSTITSMASLALNGFLQGMLLSSSDKELFDKSIERVIVLDSSLIDEPTNTTPNATVDNTVPNTTLNDSSSNRNHVTESDIESQVTVNSEKTRLKDMGTRTVGGNSNCSPRSKHVSFDARESKPLLRRQDSLDMEKSVSSPDDESENDVILP